MTSITSQKTVVLFVQWLYYKRTVDDLGFDCWMEQEICLFTQESGQDMDSTKAPVWWVPRLFPVKERLLCEVCRCTLPSFQTENAWRYTSKLAFILKSWCLVKLKDKLLFTVALLLKSIFVKWALRKRSSSSWNAIAHRFMTRQLESIFFKLHMKGGRKICWTSAYKLSLHGGRFELGKKLEWSPDQLNANTL